MGNDLAIWVSNGNTYPYQGLCREYPVGAGFRRTGFYLLRAGSGKNAQLLKTEKRWTKLVHLQF